MGKKAKIKTIDINCKEWFDKVNGNSYFAGSVTINYKMESSKTFKIKFQYGSGNHFEHEALKVLKENGYNVHFHHLKQDNIIFRSFLQKKCKKAELNHLDKMEY